MFRFAASSNGAGASTRRALALALALVARSALGEPGAPVDVVVHAAARRAPPKDTSVAGSVVSRERLEAPGLTASDVLRTEPGVAVTETGGYGELSTAAIRGATAAQTPVYLGGVRLNDDVGGVADLSLVPLFLLDRVEIYRSNAPLEADALGIGGAIFFEPRIPKRAEAGAGGMLGSFGAESLFGHAGAGNAHVAALAYVRFDAAKNDYSFTDDRGTRFDSSDDRTVTRTNADARTLDAWGIARVRFRRGHADVLVNDAEREQGLPGLTLFPSTRARGSFSRRLAAVSTLLACGSGGDCAVTASSTVLSTKTIYDDPLHEIELGAARATFGGTRVDESVRVKLRPLERVTIAPSLLASTELLDANLDAAPSIRAKRVSARAAASADLDVTDAVRLHGMGAASFNGTSGGGATPWSYPVVTMSAASLSERLDPSARVGIEIGTLPFVFLSNLGRYARVPTLGELYGISGAVRGNATLSPETGVTFDAGIRAEHARDCTIFSSAYADLFGFVRSVDDLVSYQRSSLGYVRPFNVGRARVSGAELLAGVYPVPFALVELAATLLDPRDLSKDRPANDVLPYESKMTLSPRLELTFHPRGFVNRLRATATYFYEASRYADRAGLVVIPAQGSLDLELEAATLDSRLAVRARLANALDQPRVDLIGYPLPGRAAYLALEASW